MAMKERDLTQVLHLLYVSAGTYRSMEEWSALNFITRRPNFIPCPAALPQTLSERPLRLALYRPCALLNRQLGLTTALLVSAVSIPSLLMPAAEAPSKT